MRKLILAAIGVCCHAVSAGAQCPVPAYRVGADWGASLAVSLPTRDFALAKLTCLARTLRANGPQRGSFGVTFFDSLDAARNFQGAPPEGPLSSKWRQWARALLATYSYDAAKNEEMLTLSPMGFNTAPSLMTKINLLLAAQTHCEMEMAGRCLLAAARDVSVPERVRPTAGKVVFDATVAPQGSVSRVHIVESASRSLVDAAIGDLRAWQFDSAGHPDRIRVTYSYEIDQARPRGSAPAVEWVSSGLVRVRVP